MFDKFHEECGVVGVYGHSEAATLAYLSLEQCIGLLVSSNQLGTRNLELETCNLELQTDYLEHRSASRCRAMASWLSLSISIADAA